MRTWIRGLLLAGLALLFPAGVRAQYYEVPPVLFTGPLSHPRYESGGFYTGLDFVTLKQNNHLGNQTVAVRGFFDVDGSISGVQGFQGSGTEALNTNQLHGGGTFQPGFYLTAGYRFENGFTIQAAWTHLWDHKRSATATFIPQNFAVGANFADSYLYSPVFNFPSDYSGPDDFGTGTVTPGYGIWNAAEQMTIDFVQRFDMVDIAGRWNTWQTDYYRHYGWLGSRAVVLWERFNWRTVDQDVNGGATPRETAYYSNVVSNRLYGGFVASEHELKIFESPALGVLSISAYIEAGMYLDFVKERARYGLGDRTTVATRAINEIMLAPGLQGKVGFIWYPWEAVTIHLGYDALAFFNTVAAEQPIDFNFGSIRPRWESHSRYLYGLQFGVGLVW